LYAKKHAHETPGSPVSGQNALLKFFSNYNPDCMGALLRLIGKDDASPEELNTAVKEHCVKSSNDFIKYQDPVYACPFLKFYLMRVHGRI